MNNIIIRYKEGEWTGLPLSDETKAGVQVLLVFAERFLLEEGIVFQQLKSLFPKAHIITCSTAGEIYNRVAEENTAICVAMEFERTPIAVSKGNIYNHPDSKELGQQIADQLPKEDLKYVLVISDGNLINGDALLSGIQSVLPDGVLISGGLAGDAGRFQKTLVGLNDDIREGNIVLLGLYGNHIKVAIGVEGGWDVFGPEKTITKSQGNILSEIDQTNALDLYKTYLGKYAEQLPSSALFFPISMKLDDSDSYLMRTILAIDEKKKEMTFAGDVPEGSVIRFMKSNFDRLINAASDAETSLLHQLNGTPAELVLVTSCVGRKIVLSDRVEEEVEAATDRMPANAIVTGFFSYGEIAPNGMGNKSHLHNQTITITAFAELR